MSVPFFVSVVCEINLTKDKTMNIIQFIRSLLILIKAHRQGFFLAYWDGRTENNMERYTFNHIGAPSITNYDVLHPYPEDAHYDPSFKKTLYVASMQNNPRPDGSMGVSNKSWLS